MTLGECPKCGGSKILGPRYTRVHGREKLRYTCYQCSYSWTTARRDAEERKRPDRDPKTRAILTKCCGWKIVHADNGDYEFR